MGGSGSKTKGYWPFSSSASADDAAKEGNEQSLARMRSFQNGTPFVFTRRGSMYFDEDGDLAHEFYEEAVVTKNGRKRAKLKRIQKNLIPQGIIKLDHPRLHVDFPIVICEDDENLSIARRMYGPPMFRSGLILFGMYRIKSKDKHMDIPKKKKKHSALWLCDLL